MVFRICRNIQVKGELEVTNVLGLGQWNMSGIRLSNEKVSQQEIAKRYETLTSNHWEICKISEKLFEISR